MPVSDRAALFARVRHGCRGAPAADIEAQLRGLGRAPAAALPAADVATSFLVNVLKNQGSANAAEHRSGAVSAVSAYLYAHYRSQRLVAGNDPRLAAMPWRDAGVLPRFGAVAPGESVTLSFARLGVAEMGAVVIYTGRSNPAANNLLPERHIVLLDSSDLVSDMESAWERINADMEKLGRPRGVNFIAGPSSTADIEGQLVYGAHGPRGWHVILIGDNATDALQQARAIAGR
ncbi:MAG: LUD domain-containing protein [Halioglobus sp.]|nr:LUD domain-containing protein [Halioglobus sp.]